jgi:hypothetical protein
MEKEFFFVFSSKEQIEIDFKIYNPNEYFEISEYLSYIKRIIEDNYDFYFKIPLNLDFKCLHYEFYNTHSKSSFYINNISMIENVQYFSNDYEILNSKYYYFEICIIKDGNENSELSLLFNYYSLII